MIDPLLVCYYYTRKAATRHRIVHPKVGNAMLQLAKRGHSQNHAACDKNITIGVVEIAMLKKRNPNGG